MTDIYQSERLMFRLWDLRDADSFISLCKEPGITEFGSATYRDVTETKAKDFIEKELRRFNLSKTAKFGVYLKETGALIGIAGIFEMDEPHLGQFEINYRFSKAYWGNGLGSEAAQAMINYGFDKLALNHIYASVDADNLRSQKLLKNIGMSYERPSSEPGSSEQVWVTARKHQ